MKRALLLISLMLCALTVSACAGNSPYRQYTKAYEQLWQEESFAVESRDEAYYFYAQTDREEKGGYNTEYQVTQVDGKYRAVGQLTMYESAGDDQVAIGSGDIYIHDGWQYGRMTDAVSGEEALSRVSCDDDFAVRSAIEGVIQFPENVIAEQSVESTAAGQLLTFILDAEKYFAYRYPETDAAALLTAYGESPVYTALLDEEGRIIQVTGRFYMVSEDDEPSIWDRQYTVTFTQHGGVELDFPELKDEDYLDLTPGQAVAE